MTGAIGAVSEELRLADEVLVRIQATAPRGRLERVDHRAGTCRDPISIAVFGAGSVGLAAIMRPPPAVLFEARQPSALARMYFKF